MARRLDLHYDHDFWVAVHSGEESATFEDLRAEWDRGMLVNYESEDPDQPITEYWAGFKIGTPRMLIWIWFDRMFERGLLQTVFPQDILMTEQQMQTRYEGISHLPDGITKRIALHFFNQLVALWKLARKR